jgi:hypothetical protein
MEQISANKHNPLFLYRCVACGSYWEENPREMHVITLDEVPATFPDVTLLRKPPIQSASALEDVLAILSRIDLSKLAIHPADEDIVRALESWDWLKVSEFRPLLVTAFGDIFFDTPSGIQFLDTIEGCLEPAVHDLNELSRLLSNSEGRDKWLLEGLVQGARDRGQILASDQCYDFKIAPILGGPMDADSVHGMSFVVKVNIAGQLHQQIRALPPGTRINKVTISD